MGMMFIDAECGTDRSSVAFISVTCFRTNRRIRIHSAKGFKSGGRWKWIKSIMDTPQRGIVGVKVGSGTLEIDTDNLRIVKSENVNVTRERIHN